MFGFFFKQGRNELHRINIATAYVMIASKVSIALQNMSLALQ